MKRKDSWFLLVIVTFACLLVAPAWWKGIPTGNDLQQHYQFAVSLSEAWEAGEIYPPGWAAQENKGYGGIGLRFYPPLAYAVMVAGKLLTGQWYAGSILAFAFWLALGGVGMYWWARSWLAAEGSLLAALIYLVAPYHLMQLTMSFYAEFAASAILPFCFLYATRLTRQGTNRDVLALAVAYAALLLTHLPLTVIGSLALCVYALASLRRENRQAGFIRLLAGGLLGLAASSFHWIKVVTERAWLNHNTAIYSASGSHYNYRRHFLLFFRYWWDSADPYASTFPDRAFAATLALTLPLALLFYCKTTRAERESWRGALVLLAFTFVMATPLSWVLWSNLVLLQQIQFPDRWFTVISFCLALLAGAGWEHLPRSWGEQKNRLIMLAVTGGALISLAFVFALVTRTTVYLPQQIINQITVKAVNDLNSDCWWPQWALEKGFQVPEKVIIEGRQAEIVSWQTYERVFRAPAGEPAAARVALLYYPHWQATVNDVPVKPTPASDGALTVSLPATESLVKLTFQEPAAVIWARKVAGVAWLLICLGIILSLLQVKRNRLSHSSLR